MLKKALFAVVIVAAQGPAMAQDSFSFDTVNGFLIVRMVQQEKNVFVEYLSPGGEGYLQCLALDLGGTPIAIAEPLVIAGNFTFQDLDIDLVSQVICRHRPF